MSAVIQTGTGGSDVFPRCQPTGEAHAWRAARFVVSIVHGADVSHWDWMPMCRDAGTLDAGKGALTWAGQEGRC